VSRPVDIPFIENVHETGPEKVSPDTARQVLVPLSKIEAGAYAPREARFHFGKRILIIPPDEIVFLF
jgi:hypothetical protein